jgi:hypothetical protein
MKDRHAQFAHDIDGLNGQVPIHQFVYGIHVSLKHRYIFVETPKAGCTSIKQLLINAELDGHADIQHGSHVHLREYSPLLSPMQVGSLRRLIADGFFTFCFVRNPHTRFLSAYLDKILRNGTQSNVVKLQMGLPLHKAHRIPFPAFIRAVEAQPVPMMDPHWRTQYHQTFQSSFAYDFCGRFENFEADLRQVCDRIGIDFDKYHRPQLEHSVDAGAKLAAHYGPELRKRVARIYAIDFETFGYEK